MTIIISLHQRISMNKPIIFVSAATGKTGQFVTQTLLRQGFRVRAAVRTFDARAEVLKTAGAEVITADLFEPEHMTRAMRGAQRAYFCPPFSPHALQAANAFAIAARAVNLEHIAVLSQWLASPNHPSLLTRHHWLIDRLLLNLPGVSSTIINPGFFADNYLRVIYFPAQFGIMPNVTGTSRNAPPSLEDIARIVAAALIDPERHAGRTYRPTGPELLSVPDMAAILSRVLKRPVRALKMSTTMFIKAARADGVGPYEMAGFRHYVKDHQQGAFETGAPNNHVLEVTGQAPENFENIARRYAAHPRAARNATTFLKELAHFMRIGLTPAYDLNRYERSLEWPKPARPEYALESETWLEEHQIRAISNQSTSTEIFHQHAVS
jgi:NAD(P)H dehydrogenase (quinone)